ncbi:NADH dehydrogenase [ubiquinone] 1 beta subcomplex subunit 9 [Strongyloides ratti]|uniref:NADH dehydrogenase [ubiquinone] 1 beta subcomplex subunit 9 n=1 Tax=Strongyloides ratti TaxID=34506 RepID=A0A090MYL5_STRRB|nr:NADH dehydrogenase [ubiquinone] 1 beta subcomplex subunit 9 [Strongyloides ratti]CEF67394.1 NADH dehydrogenase [ubiquinone] 1 beta subcomplex subunit 9 [Strongyloides ratti]
MDSPAWMFTKALSHRQKVMRLYKRAIREIDSWYGGDILEVRYQKVLMRARFDANKDVPDPRKAQLLLADGCRQLWEMRNPKPFRFASDPGGSSFDRERQSSDILLDTQQWTFAEREQFPYYFNKREQRKKELLEFWDKIDKSWDNQIAAIQTELPKEKVTSTTQ